MGRGSANIKVKVKNLRSGASTEKGYINNANVLDVNLEKKDYQEKTAKLIKESDKTNPINYYGETRVEGEKNIQNIEYFIYRISVNNLEKKIFHFFTTLLQHLPSQTGF